MLEVKGLTTFVSFYIYLLSAETLEFLFQEEYTTQFIVTVDCAMNLFSHNEYALVKD